MLPTDLGNTTAATTCVFWQGIAILNAISFVLVLTGGELNAAIGGSLRAKSETTQERMGAVHDAGGSGTQWAAQLGSHYTCLKPTKLAAVYERSVNAPIIPVVLGLYIFG